MTIINSLSSSLGQKKNDANIALAKLIAEKENQEAIKELIDNLKNKDKRIQGDCIKVLYEIAYVKPELIAGHYSHFIDLIQGKNNRLIWGAMIAIAMITDLKHKQIFESLDVIKRTVDNGSVITIDCGVEIYAKLNKRNEYIGTVEPLLLDQLWKCPIKQLSQYMEKSFMAITKKNKEIYQDIIEKRITDCDKESQKKRLEKVLKKITTQ